MEQNETNNNYHRELRAYRKAMGTCSWCGKSKVEPGKSLCIRCKVICKERARARYQNLPIDKKSELLEKKRLSRLENKAKGICYMCSDPADEGYVLCPRHREYYKERYKRSRESE